MRHLLTVIADVIFPPTKAEKMLRSATTGTLHKLYKPGKHFEIEYLCRYQETLIQAAVLENKFHRHQLAARLLGQMLNNYPKAQSTQTLFVPIPLGKKRLRQRGHNQVETILQACKLPIQINTRLLQRVIETKPQTKLDKELRQQNMQQAFQFTGVKLDESIRHIVLVDDVVTTGATLNAARAKLAPHLPPQVTLSCLAIAH